MQRATTAALLTAAMTCHFAHADTIRLQSGDVITADILDKDADSVTIDHPSLGELTIKRDQIVQIYADRAALDAALAEEDAAKKAEELEAERAADDGLFGQGVFLKGWNRQLEIGIKGDEGNTKSFDFRIKFKGDFEDAEDRWLFNMLYNIETDDGSATDEQFTTELFKDWLIPGEDYFYFANGRYDWDKFEDWDSRWSGFGGIGYQFIDDDKWNLRGRAGLGGNQEMGGTQGDEFTPEAFLGIEGDYQISEKHSFAFSNYLYPSLDEGGEFRNITAFDYIILIDRDKGLSLKLGMTNEHDSTAPATSKKNDFSYYATMIWQF